MAFLKKYNLTSADANKTILLGSAPGRLSHVTINKADAHAVTLFDDMTATSPTSQIAAIAASVTAQTLWYKCELLKGLAVTIAASFAGDMTIVYSEDLVS